MYPIRAHRGHQPQSRAWILSVVDFGLVLLFVLASTLPRYGNSIHIVDNDMLEQRLSAEQAANSTLLWGTYRPNLYFGTRPRLPQSVLTGLMWFSLDDYSGFRHIRHSCEQGDDFERYGYLKHDGRFFGMQELVDGGSRYTIKTELVKRPGGEHGGDWVARISGTPNVTDVTPSHISVLFYVGYDGMGHLNLHNPLEEQGYTDPIILVGESEGLGNYSITVTDEESSQVTSHVWGTAVTDGDTWHAKNYLEKHLMHKIEKLAPESMNDLPKPEILFQIQDRVIDDANLYFIQKQFTGPFQFDVVFKSSSSPSPLIGSMDATIKDAYSVFDARFETIFQLESKGYSKSHIDFAKSAMSNLLGGIGYFYGDSIVDRTPDEQADRDELDEDEFPVATPHPEKTKPTSLFTATPSRSFFPRGFLWDEGFHQMLVGQWDNDLSLDIMRSWFSLMDDDGWIAREQILGNEARSKVPEEFQTQFPHYANPPTLIIPVRMFMERQLAYEASLEEGEMNDEVLEEREQAAKKRIVTAEDPEIVRNRHLLEPRLGTDYLLRMYPYLRRFYQWFRRTQRGEIKRWGRSAPSREAYRWRGRTLNHTLTSGLDDYPRSAPHPGELHLDLLCWMGYTAKTLRMVAERLEEPDDVEEYEQEYQDVLANLDALHWNEEEQIYCDLTVDHEDESQFACHRGYITLFPLLLGLLSPDSPQLGSLLDLMHDPMQLWTDYGLRSLSKQDPYFGEGENYWRGPIWMNMNYLALSSLHKNYVSVEGPHQKQAAKIYRQLRRNVVSNISKVYKKTGFLWEQYDEETGEGKRSHPFSGWSALVVLIMAEKY